MILASEGPKPVQRVREPGSAPKRDLEARPRIQNAMREVRDTDRTGAAPELVVVGELNVDLILERLNDGPALGKERVARGMTLTLGSSSAILASNASRLGLNVGFVGCVGPDSFGAFVRDALVEAGVDVTHLIEREGEATGLTVIYTYAGDRGMLTYPGAMETLTFDELPLGWITSARHLHLSSYYLQPSLRPSVPDLYRAAKDAGLSTSFDTNWDPEEAWADDIYTVFPYVDVFLPNDVEARRIAREDDLQRAIEKLARHVGVVVVTCGKDGVVARRGDEQLHVDALPVVPVDAVGAGDSFNAGFLSRYVRGGDLAACLTAGTISAAFSTTCAGGTTAFRDAPRYRLFEREMRELAVARPLHPHTAPSPDAGDTPSAT